MKKKSKCERREYVKKYLFLPVGRNKYPEDTVTALSDFLNLFDDIYDYCEKMYHLQGEKGHTFVKKLIETGKAIEVGEKKYNVEEYCNLATEYWKIKKDFLLQRIPEESKEFIDKNIDDPNI